MLSVVTLMDLILAPVKLDILEMGQLAAVRRFFCFGFIVVVVVDLQWCVCFCYTESVEALLSNTINDTMT